MVDSVSSSHSGNIDFNVATADSNEILIVVSQTINPLCNALKVYSSLGNYCFVSCTTSLPNFQRPARRCCCCLLFKSTSFGPGIPTKHRKHCSEMSEKIESRFPHLSSFVVAPNPPASPAQVCDQAYSLFSYQYGSPSSCR